MATRTVLLIDDDLQFYGELSQTLSPYGFELHQADHNEESLSLASTLGAEVILIAVDEPKKVGYGLCRKAKKAKGGPPVVLVTRTIAAADLAKHGQTKMHADAYLDHRDLSDDKLYECIDSLIGLGELVENEDVIAIDMDEDLVVDDFEMVEVDELNDSKPISPFDGIEDEADAAFAALGMSEDDAVIGQKSPSDSTLVVSNSELIGNTIDLTIESEVNEFLDESPTVYEYELESADDATPAPEESAVQALGDMEIEIDEEISIESETIQIDEEAAATEAAEAAAAEAAATEAAAAEAAAAEAAAAEAAAAEAAATEAAEAAEAAATEAAAAATEAETAFVEVAVADDLDLGLDDIAAAAAVEQEAAGSVSSEELASLKAEIERLTKEVAATRSTSSGGEAFSREHQFLDLREKINKKEKELLDAQDQVTAKDRLLLDSKDQLRKLERSKSELNDSNLTLEQELLKAKEGAAALNAEIKKAIAEAKNAQDTHQEALRKRNAEHETALDNADKSLVAAQAIAAQEQAAAISSLQENADALLANKLADAESDKQTALSKASELAAAALESLRAEGETALATASEETEVRLSELKTGFEAATQESVAQKKADIQSLEDQHAGQLSRLRSESEDKREQLETAQASALEAADIEHQAATEKALEFAAGEMTAAQAGHEQALAAAQEVHEVNKAEALAAAEAQKKQELGVAAGELAAMDSRRQGELHNAGEEREASEAQLAEKASEDRKALEQEHADVVATFRKEAGDLETALSSNRDKLSETEKALSESGETVALRDSTIEGNEQTIALRDDQIQTLKTEVSELEGQNTGYQEQVLKAYQKIKSDENTVGRAKKALAIALTLLDESEDLHVEADGESTGEEAAVD